MRFFYKAKILRIASLDNNLHASSSPSWIQWNEISLNYGLFASDLVQTISSGNFIMDDLPSDQGITSLNSLLDGKADTFARFSGI